MENKSIQETGADEALAEELETEPAETDAVTETPPDEGAELA